MIDTVGQLSTVLVQISKLYGYHYVEEDFKASKILGKLFKVVQFHAFGFLSKHVKNSIFITYVQLTKYLTVVLGFNKKFHFCSVLLYNMYYVFLSHIGNVLLGH